PIPLDPPVTNANFMRALYFVLINNCYLNYVVIYLLNHFAVSLSLSKAVKFPVTPPSTSSG
ncbi:MAG: hypothetical protein ABIR78_13475, partial [Ferruginibacter sp.]